MEQHVLVTGGAGYVGSVLTGVLLARGDRVTVVDKLLFGGESLLAHRHHPRFRFSPGDLTEPGTLSPSSQGLQVGRLPPARIDAVVHLAAIVGFPACQAVGPEVAFRYNTEAARLAFEAAEAAGVDRFVLASTYSNYGLSGDGGPVFNVGGDALNHTKEEIVALVQRHVPGTRMEVRDLTFGSDMRDVRVSFAKIRRVLGFEPKLTVEDGIREVKDALECGLIRAPRDARYRNAHFIVQ